MIARIVPRHLISGPTRDDDMLYRRRAGDGFIRDGFYRHHLALSIKTISGKEPFCFRVIQTYRGCVRAVT